MKCQIAAAITGAKQVICGNNFWQFLKNFYHGQSMHYHSYSLTVIPLLKENILPDTTPTKNNPKM